MNKITSFNRNNVNHNDLVKHHNAGHKVICPLCKSELIFQKSGVWCPVNANHYSVQNYSADIVEQTRKSSRKRGIEKTVKALEAKGYTKSQIRAEILKYYPEAEPSTGLTEDSQKKVFPVGHSKRKRPGSRTSKTRLPKRQSTTPQKSAE